MRSDFTRIRALTVVGVTALVVTGLSAAPAAATFPGSNGVIVFDYWPSGAAGVQIFSVNPSTQVVKNLSGTHTGDDQPAASANGKRIAFRHGGDIWIMNIDGTKRKDITPSLFSAQQPAWSPDGTKLVFNNNNGLSIVNADGTNLHGIVTTRDNSQPSWSPNGKLIAFTSDRSGPQQIWTVRPNGTNRVNVSKDKRYSENDPDWAPSGLHIAFNTNRSEDGLREIFQAAPDGSAKTEIAAAEPSGAYSPAYSPDGTQLALTRNDNGSIEVAIEPVGVAGDGTLITTLPGTSLEYLSWAATAG